MIYSCHINFTHCFVISTISLIHRYLLHLHFTNSRIIIIIKNHRRRLMVVVLVNMNHNRSMMMMMAVVVYCICISLPHEYVWRIHHLHLHSHPKVIQTTHASLFTYKIPTHTHILTHIKLNQAITKTNCNLQIERRYSTYERIYYVCSCKNQ